MFSRGALTNAQVEKFKGGDRYESGSRKGEVKDLLALGAANSAAAFVGGMPADGPASATTGCSLICTKCSTHGSAACRR
jgi:hypothetical protein